jgi:uncharacterized protein (DUF488 family)
MTKRTPGQAPMILTIGHSTHTLADFIGLLQAHAVLLVVDIRTVPRSRHNPQFNRDTLPGSLQAAGIGYVHMPGLGGLRHARHDSPNTAWRVASFRGFADYMQTPEFEESLAKLIDTAERNRVALMCAEAVPWRCHRSLIADALLARGITVEHIMSATHRQAHTLTPWANIEGTRVTYPGQADLELEKHGE